MKAPRLLWQKSREERATEARDAICRGPRSREAATTIRERLTRYSSQPAPAVVPIRIEG